MRGVPCESDVTRARWAFWFAPGACISRAHETARRSTAALGRRNRTRAPFDDPSAGVAGSVDALALGVAAALALTSAASANVTSAQRGLGCTDACRARPHEAQG